MEKTGTILTRIKETVARIAPDAEVILYGSRARGDHHADSDYDVLVLLHQEEVTWEDEKRVKYALYDIEFDTGFIISPLVLAKKDWETRHRITPLYENVTEEGIVL